MAGDKGESIVSNDNQDIEDIDANLADKYTFAITPQTDDPSSPALSFRSMFLGCIWGIFLACINAIFSFRTIPFIIPGGTIFS
jgi:hypothetical protein